MHGHALMPDGRAMSKSKNITVEPGEVMEEYGADPMRLFLLSVTPQGDDMRFSWEETETMQRDLNILWNAFRFPLPYMEMDGVDPTDLDVSEVSLEPIDRWLLSRLQTVESEAEGAWADFEQHRALEAILEYVVEDVSRYYIQVVRERMWEAADTDSKRAAYATLTHVLQEVIGLLAPYAPFVTEELYQRLTGDDGLTSVHMLDFPEADPTLQEESLEAAVEDIRAVEEAGSRARQEAGRKLRWPVTRIVVDAADESVLDSIAAHEALLADRLNAREIETVEPGTDWGELAYTATADMSELGPAFGDQAHAVMEALNAARVPEPDIEALEEAVAADLGESIDLEASMVDFEVVPPESVAGADFDGGRVYVDASLTRDVESEGYAREIIRRAQEMRKTLDLEMDARVRLEVVVYDERVGELLAEREDLIAEEVRATEIGDVEDGHRESWEIEGTKVELAIEPVAG
jgi:isoleucyl-tRNA synthetase